MSMGTVVVRRSGERAGYCWLATTVAIQFTGCPCTCPQAIPCRMHMMPGFCSARGEAVVFQTSIVFFRRRGGCSLVRFWGLVDRFEGFRLNA
jgi:hypothetical protein